MQIMENSQGFLIRLVRGEKVMSSMARITREKEIPSGSFVGLGAVCNTTLAYYNLTEKKYVELPFPDEMELTNLTGNLSWLNEEPVVHCHAAVANKQLQTYSGHLIETEVAVTAEIALRVFEKKIVRGFDEEIGLNLLAMNEF